MGSGDFYRLALWFVLIAAGLALAGFLLSFGSRHLGWFGRLPGDIRIDGENYTIRIPLVSGLLLSLLITLIANLIRRR